MNLDVRSDAAAAARWGVLLLVGAVMLGCGDGAPKAKPKSKHSKSSSSGKSRRKEREVTTYVSETAPGPAARPKSREGGRSFASLLEDDEKPRDDGSPENGPILGTQRLPMIDPDAVRRHGIRAVRGKHLTLYTDLPEGPAVDELPEVFDQAVPQWCDYLGIAPDRIAAWHVRAFLIGDKVRFTAAKLIPESLPEFLNGFAYQTELWLNEQKSDYYRRHLLLHEGTHALMNSAKGRAGAPWYMEGTAELLATHRWANGRLQLRRMPASRDEVPLWGRIKIVKDEYAANRGMTVEEILGYDHRAHLRNEPYGWCWALCAFLDGHPEYKSAFRSLYKESDRLDADFNQVAVERFKGDWNGLREQWRLFVAGLEYGHDIAKTTVDFTPGKPLAADGTSIPVAADRGWQNTGWRLEKGMEYRLNAAGRYVIARTDRAWWCEPAGVTIRYYQGRPLGQLLAAVRPDDHDPAKTSPLAVPTAVGLSATLVPEKSGTLFLRVNDSAGQLHDNEGSLDVLVTPSN